MQTNNKLREAMLSVKADILKRSSENVWYITVSDIIEKIDAALAEPPRNCERFRNADEALEALERHCNSSGNGCIRCPVAGFSTEEVECKIAWLFALATEQEGGAK